MKAGTIRQPAVAGRFYPANGDAVRAEVAELLKRGAPPEGVRRAACVMAPHAGYVYSGGIAGRVFAAVDIPETVVVLCPNHTGRGERIAIAPDGAFAMPGGDIAIDGELAAAIEARVPGAVRDLEAHRGEHAIEVELPFLRQRRPDVRIVPIVLAGLSEAQAIGLGESLHDAVQATGRDALVVASSDMSHFLPEDTARRVDHVALEPLLAFDAHGLYRTVVDNDISMCGFIPATAMLGYAARAKAGQPALVGYATSADAFGDRDRVVGYAGVVVPAA